MSREKSRQVKSDLTSTVPQPVSSCRTGYEGESRLLTSQCSGSYHKDIVGPLCNTQFSTSNVHNRQNLTFSQHGSQGHLVLSSSSYTQAVSIRAVCSNFCNYKIQRHQRHLHSSSEHSLRLFGKLLLLFTFLLSLCTFSYAHKLPWDSWTIEETTSSDVSQGYRSTLKVSDLAAVVGRLFQYRITGNAFSTRTVHYQAREAGRNKLPNWISFNQTSATFKGVPLLQDRGQLYITLDVYASERGRSVSTSEALFSVHVLPSNTSKATNERLLEKSVDGSVCQPNHNLSLENVLNYPTCSDSSLPVLASLVTFVNMRKLSGFARADIFLALSNAIGICPHLLVMDSIKWSSREGMKLWRQLAESGNIEYLDFTTILSFQLSCSTVDFNNQSVVSYLTNLDLYLANQSDITADEVGSQLNFLYLRWFVSRGSEVLRSSVAAPEEVHSRLRRQTAIEAVAEPVIDIINPTTTLPELVSASIVTSSQSTSSSLQKASSATLSTEDSTASVSPTLASDSSTALSAVGSLTSTYSKENSSTISGQISTQSSQQTTVFRTAETTASTPFPTSAINSSIKPRTSDQSSQVILSSIMVLPTVLELSSASQASTAITSNLVASSEPIVPSSRVVPSSEATLNLQPSSLPLSITPSVTRSLSVSMESTAPGPELVASSLPVMSMMFSVQSPLTSLPILTESVFPTTSGLPSRSFMIQSSIDDLPSSTSSLPLSSSLQATSSSTFPESSTQSLTPDMTTLILSPSVSFKQSSSLAITPLPTMSSFTAGSSSSVRDVTRTSIFPTSGLSSLRPTASTLAPQPTSSILLPELTSFIFTPDFTSDLLMPETSIVLSSTTQLPDSSSEPSLSFSVEPTATPSFSSELPPISTSIASSSIVQTSSNNMLMPMSSSELTLSVSIFTPSQFPSSLVEITSTIDIFPMPSLTATFSSSLTDSSMQSTILEMSSMDSFSPFITSSIAVSSELIQPSSSEILFPETSTFDPFTTLSDGPPSLSITTLQPTVTVRSSSPLTPMPSSEPALSLSTFMTFRSMSVSETDLPTSEPSVSIFPTETVIIFPDSTTVDGTISTVATIGSPTPSVSNTPVITTIHFSSSQRIDVETSTIIFSPTPVALTTMLPSPTPTSPMTPVTPSATMIPLTPSTLLRPSMSPSPAPTSCEANDINCGNGSCLNDSAINQTTMIYCSCFPDFTGTFCSNIINDCNPFPCFANGTSVCIDGNGTFSCTCNVGYTGRLCNEEIDNCASLPCQLVEATCINLGLGEFECFCPPGYSGTFCEIDTDPCNPFPCNLNETCVTTDSQNFTCIVLSNSSVVASMAVTSTIIAPRPSPTSAFVATTSHIFSTIVSRTSPVSRISSTVTILSSMTPIPTPSRSQLSTTTTTATTTTTETRTPSLTPTVTSSPPVVNLRPMLLNPIGTLIVNVGQVFLFSIPENTFYDPETGTTSLLSLTLLNFRGDQLPNTTWIQVKRSNLEGLPLSSETINEAITDHLFILQAQDELGSSAHDFVTIRVLPLGPFSSFLTVLFENSYESLDQNLTQKIILVQRLSSSAISSSLQKRQQLQLPTGSYNADEIFIREIFNTNSLAVTYKNLTIPDLNCADFYTWIETIYNFMTNEYTRRFLEAMEPEFLPTPTPRIEGICSVVTTNIPPTLAGDREIDISDSRISHRYFLLSTLVPAACLALCCLLLGLCALCLYRRRRSERKYLTSRRLYLSRRPIILEGEVDLPDRRRRPIVLENEIATLEDVVLHEERDGDEDRHSNASSDSPPAAGDRERLLQPALPPPIYRLPPLYDVHRQLHNNLHDD